MNKIFILALIALSSCSQKSKTAEINMESSSDIIAIKNFHYFTVPTLDENGTLKMADYKGKKILFVNVASKCGFTSQYDGLQELYKTYKDKLVVIGLPCNQFGGQEPGTAKEIVTFCKANYGVDFPLSSKIEVKGASQHPLYKWLTTKVQNGVMDSKVRWNFQKYLVDESGQLIDYFYATTKPMSSKIVKLL